MSNIIYNSYHIPDLSQPTQTWRSEMFPDIIDNVRLLSIDENKVSQTFPDPKAFRSMTRAALFASMEIRILKQKIDSLQITPYDIGLYAAFENGPIDGPSTLAIYQQAPSIYDEKFADSFKKRRNPKMYLKQLPNLAAAQVGIFLNIQGPMNVFTHSQFASLQALEQAEWDLSLNKVKAALLISANAFEDYFAVKRVHLHEMRTVCEGVGILLLSQSQSSESPVFGHDALFSLRTDWKAKISADSNNYFGIADQLINIVRAF